MDHLSLILALIYSGTINVVLDNFIFENNTVSNSYSKNSLSLDLGIIGDNGKISDNLFFNGTAGFTLYGNNSVIERNTFEKYGHFYRVLYCIISREQQ